MILGQLPRLSRRTRFLQRAMRRYLAVSLLMMASIWIGAAGLLGQTFGIGGAALGPVLLAIAGAAALAYGAMLLSIESSLSALTTREEMRFLEALGVYYAGLLVEETEST